MVITIIGMICEFIIGAWLSWYMFTSEHKTAGVITSLFAIVVMVISYRCIR